MDPNQEGWLREWYLERSENAEQIHDPYWREVSELSLSDGVAKLLNRLHQGEFDGPEMWRHFASKVRRRAKIDFMRKFSARRVVRLSDKVASNLRAESNNAVVKGRGAAEILLGAYVKWLHQRGEWPLMMRHFYDGQSAEDLAEELGVSERTIYNRIRSEQSSYRELSGEFEEYCLHVLNHIDGLVTALGDL